MKILFVGDLRSHARSYQRFRALKDLGHDVVGLLFVPSEKHQPQKTHLLRLVYEKICHKLGFPIDKASVNKRIPLLVEEHSPDMLWIEKGLMITPVTLRQACNSNSSLKIISYTEDDMYNRLNQSHYYRTCLPLYDLVVTTKSYNTNPEELPAMGARRVFFVDNAYDKNFHRPISLNPADIDAFGAAVGFVGTFEKDRAEKMLCLAQQGIKVRIWGNGWSSWVGKDKNLKIENRPVYNDEYIKVLCATKINLCFLRKINRDLQTARTMEIPACGAFMLAERTTQHQRLFTEDKEAAYFNIDDKEELLQKVTYYLNNDEKRRRIAEAGRRRCIESGYSHHDRLEQILKEVFNETNTIN